MKKMVIVINDEHGLLMWQLPTTVSAEISKLSPAIRADFEGRLASILEIAAKKLMLTAAYSAAMLANNDKEPMEEFLAALTEVSDKLLA